MNYVFALLSVGFAFLALRKGANSSKTDDQSKEKAGPENESSAEND